MNLGPKKYGPGQWTALIGTVLFVFLFPSLIKSPSYRAPFLDTPLKELQEINPEFIFIGNSMLGTRIHGPRLEELLGGRKIYLLKEGGTYSAHWYLKLKNYVVASGVKPKFVFIFFRGRALMTPEKNTDGIFLESLQAVSHEDDPVLTKILESRKTAWQKSLDRVNKFYTVRSYRKDANRKMLILPAIPAIPEVRHLFFKETFPRYYNSTLNERELYVLYYKTKSFTARLNLTFHIEGGGLRNISPRNLDIGEPEELDRYNLSANVDNSFIPPMIETARAAGLKLVFVRVQTIPGKDGVVRFNDRENKFIKDLKTYVEKNGCGFYDFSGDPEITREMFMDQIHISADHKIEYTDVFYKRMEPYFK